jgi:hypothetical protein
MVFAAALMIFKGILYPATLIDGQQRTKAERRAATAKETSAPRSSNTWMTPCTRFPGLGSRKWRGASAKSASPALNPKRHEEERPLRLQLPLLCRDQRQTRMTPRREVFQHTSHRAVFINTLLSSQSRSLLRRSPYLHYYRSLNPNSRQPTHKRLDEDGMTF